MSENMIRVTVFSDDIGDSKQLTVDPTQLVHMAIAEALGGCKTFQVLFGENDIHKDDRFVDHDMEVDYCSSSL